MASVVRDETRGRPNYNSTLCLCLLSSLGVCLAFLPYIPLTIDKTREIIFTVSKIIMVAVILLVWLLLIRFIRYKDKFHQAQLVFWPNRCQHCARVLVNLRSVSYKQNNIMSRGYGIDGAAATSSPINIQFDVNAATRPCSSGLNAAMTFSGTSHFMTNGTGSFPRTIPAAPLTSPPEIAITAYRSQHQGGTSIPNTQEIATSDEQFKFQHAFARRHRSLVNIFNLFCLVALFGLPFLVFNKFECIVNNDGPIAKLISGEIYDLLLLSLIPVAMVFSIKYYDAIFVTTTGNCYSILVFISCGIWISAVKLVLPVGTLLGFDDIGSSCRNNNTYADILLYGERAMTPFFTEGAIIATCIVWQMWTSFVSRSELYLDREMPHYNAFSMGTSPHWFQTFPPWLKSCFAKCRKSEGNSEEEHELIPKITSPTKYDRHIFKIVIVAVCLSVLYFIVSLWLIFDDYSLFPYKETQRVYVGWTLEIFFYTPYFIFFVRIKHLSKGRVHQPLYSQLSLQGHDILLLLCTCGIFCQVIFRMTSGFGLLLSQRAKNGDELATWIFSLLYSVFVIFLIFNLTSFLLRVQRQAPIGQAETKWVLSFLCYITVANSTEWLIDSIIVETWVVQCQFFGQTTGRVVGTLLDPFTTLYGLHASMVAYETYKTIMKRNLNKDVKTNQSESEEAET